MKIPYYFYDHDYFHLVYASKEEEKCLVEGVLKTETECIKWCYDFNPYNIGAGCLHNKCICLDH